MLTKPEKLHPTAVTTTDAGEELGRQIMALRYDHLRQVLTGMRKECLRQAEGDFDRGRDKLARLLSRLAADFSAAEGHGEEIEALCARFIEAEKQVQG